jgi:anti-sigma factor RsiW
VSCGLVFAPNEPNSPAGVLPAVVIGVSYETEFPRVDASDIPEDELLAATRRLLAGLSAIGETTTLCNTRREFDRVSFAGVFATLVEIALSEISSRSEELATEVRVVAVLSSLLLGLRASRVIVAISHTKSAIKIGCTRQFSVSE